MPIVTPESKSRMASVRGADAVHGFAEHTIIAAFTDADGNWTKDSVLADVGPYGGEYARLLVSDQDLEKFALGILSALHDKRKGTSS
jgi:hypothetical protein